MKFDLLNNQNKRELMMIEERLDILDKVKEVVFIKGTEYMTTQMVADYYEVTEDTIKTVTIRNKEELIENGYINVKSEDLNNIFESSEWTFKTCGDKTELSNNDLIINVTNEGLNLFNKRAILNVGTLLEDSPIAEEVRTLLLDNHEQLINVSDDLENEEEIAEEDINESDPTKIENREFYVYAHVRLDNNMCFYVGKGKGKRKDKKTRGLLHDNISNKYGHKVVIIANNLTEKEAFKLERKTIKYYVCTLGYGIYIKGYYVNTENKKFLTNCTWGGEGASGYKHSEESKRKNSESHKGKKQSEETKIKKSEAMKGENNPMFGKNPYANKTPEEIKIISNKKSNSMKGKNKGKNAFANKTEEEMGIIGRKISEKVSGEKSGMWGKNPYANKTEEEMEIISNKKSNSMKGKNAGEKNGMWGKPSPNRSKVICITTGKTFNSVTKASNHYKVARSGISNCCRGKCKHAGELQDGTKLQWKYLEDYNNDFKGILINSNN